MTMAEKEYTLKASGARTSDWLGQIKDGVIYAYDMSTFGVVEKDTDVFTKEDFETALKKVSRKIKK